MSSVLSDYLQLRLVVGFLGERAQFGWWPTAFVDAASRSFLEPAFPKTYALAQYHAVVEAARRLHDEHLNVGSYHLFRFPEEVEQDLHSLMRTGTADEIFKQTLRGKEEALGALKALAAGKAPEHEGPIALGNIKDYATPKVLNALANVYATAFTRGTRAFPYLVA